MRYEKKDKEKKTQAPTKPLPKRNPNYSKRLSWEQWEGESETFSIEVLKDLNNGIEKGVTLDVFRHPIDERFFCVCQSWVSKPWEVLIISKECAKVIFI